MNPQIRVTDQIPDGEIIAVSATADPQTGERVVLGAGKIIGLGAPEPALHWKCTKCGRVMTQNMSACPNCGNTVFAPVKPEPEADVLPDGFMKTAYRQVADGVYDWDDDALKQRLIDKPSFRAAVDAVLEADRAREGTRQTPNPVGVGDETPQPPEEAQIPAEEFIAYLADLTARANAATEFASLIYMGKQQDRPTVEPVVSVLPSRLPTLPLEPKRDAGSLVADLLDVSANLEETIQTRARERAKLQVGAAIAEADRQMQVIADRRHQDMQRADDVIADLNQRVSVLGGQVQRIEDLIITLRDGEMTATPLDLDIALRPLDPILSKETP